MKVKVAYLVDLIGLAIALILWTNQDSYFASLIRFLEATFSPDHHINTQNTLMLSFFYSLLPIGFALMAILHLTGLLRKIWNRLTKVVRGLIDLPRLIRFFTEDPISPRLSKYTFFVGFAGVFFLYFFYLLLVGIMSKSENPIETATSFFFLIAALFLLRSSFLVSKTSVSSKHQGQVRFALIILSLLLILIFGEEISWGQHWMGWEASGIFQTRNFQQETNVHNFFNPLFNLVYPLVGAGLFLAGFALWLFPIRSNSGLSRILTPHPSLFPILFAASFYSFRGHSEIFEEYLGLLFLLYSLRVYLGFRCTRCHQSRA